MRQHWPVGYDGEAAIYNEDDFRQIYDAYMEEKRVHPGLDAANTVDVEAVRDLLNGDLRDVVGATASRRNERRRRDLARIRGMNRADADVYLVRYGLLEPANLSDSSSDESDEVQIIDPPE
jgi:hypothetical protein